MSKLCAHRVSNLKLGKLWTNLIFIFFAILGFAIVSDYGVGFDEFVNRKNGSISFYYVNELINSILGVNSAQSDAALINHSAILKSYQDRDYGVGFDLPAFAIERFLEINSPYWQHVLRHALTYCIFLAGCSAIFKTIRYYHNNFWLAVLSIIIFVLSPRIFGDAFHNSKDIVFMSAYAIATYLMIQFFSISNFKTTLFFAIITAFAINLRIIGVIFLVATTIIFFLRLIRRYSRIELANYSIYLAVSIALTIAFWPWLWANPIDNFIAAFLNMSKFRWDGWVLYLGDLYPVRQLPWHYLPVWIGVSTPIFYIFLFIVGTGAAIKSVCVNAIRLRLKMPALQDLIILGLFFGPILLVLISKPVLYDGWRQFYFVYPAFVCLIIRGLSVALDSNRYRRTVHLLISVLGLFTITSTILWMIKAHPYQSVYLSPIVPKINKPFFELDYWGLSNIELLRFLVRYQPKGLISVAGLGITSLEQSLPLLSLDDRVRVQIAPDFSDATYVLTNYRLLDPSQRPIFNALSADWDSLFDIKVDGRTIASLFVRKAQQ